jgi:hypothetical protein
MEASGSTNTRYQTLKYSGHNNMRIMSQRNNMRITIQASTIVRACLELWKISLFRSYIFSMKLK